MNLIDSIDMKKKKEREREREKRNAAFNGFNGFNLSGVVHSLLTAEPFHSEEKKKKKKKRRKRGEI